MLRCLTLWFLIDAPHSRYKYSTFERYIHYRTVTILTLYILHRYFFIGMYLAHIFKYQ